MAPVLILCCLVSSWLPWSASPCFVISAVYAVTRRWRGFKAPASEARGTYLDPTWTARLAMWAVLAVCLQWRTQHSVVRPGTRARGTSLPHCPLAVPLVPPALVAGVDGPGGCSKRVSVLRDPWKSKVNTATCAGSQQRYTNTRHMLCPAYSTYIE